MGWERRYGGSYYYRATRVGDRVAKRYLGRGPLGELAALLDEEARRSRATESAVIAAAAASLAPADALLAELEAACSTMLDATLVAAGFRRHDRGEWRRRRARN
jgi:hypothetical protein